MHLLAAPQVASGVKQIPTAVVVGPAAPGWSGGYVQRAFASSDSAAGRGRALSAGASTSRAAAISAEAQPATPRVTPRLSPHCGLQTPRAFSPVSTLRWPGMVTSQAGHTGTASSGSRLEYPPHLGYRRDTATASSAPAAVTTVCYSSSLPNNNNHIRNSNNNNNHIHNNNNNNNNNNIVVSAPAGSAPSGASGGFTIWDPLKHQSRSSTIPAARADGGTAWQADLQRISRADQQDASYVESKARRRLTPSQSVLSRQVGAQQTFVARRLTPSASDFEQARRPALPTGPAVSGTPRLVTPSASVERIQSWSDLSTPAVCVATMNGNITVLDPRGRGGVNSARGVRPWLNFDSDPTMSSEMPSTAASTPPSDFQELIKQQTRSMQDDGHIDLGMGEGGGKEGTDHVLRQCMQQYHQERRFWCEEREQLRAKMAELEKELVAARLSAPERNGSGKQSKFLKSLAVLSISRWRGRGRRCHGCRRRLTEAAIALLAGLRGRKASKRRSARAKLQRSMDSGYSMASCVATGVRRFVSSKIGS
ncbi:unnamed protein product [Polarella glacialis]|uniref:Uncharacterized protein n=1 Tax=Polarella glacialis TaxID=89957 RepID=A0A813I4H4_POLGL|nr:unnamed protein product [Polarella glacialis]